MSICGDIERIRSALWGVAPFMSSILHRVRIIETTEVETAAVDARTWIYINPKFWAKLDFLGQAYVISHEVTHSAFGHPARGINKAHLPWNLAVDSVVFGLLCEMIRCPEVEANSVSARTIGELTGADVGDIEKMSAEEMYELLMKHAKKIRVKIVDIIPGNGPAGGTVIQEGEGVFTSGSANNVKEVWKDLATQAYMAQRTAGTIPAGLERLVGELIRPKLDPRTLIRQSIRFGLGKTVISDWRIPSRRQPDSLPGIRRLTVPTIWALVDASGSIGENELKLFLGTVYEFARQTTVHTMSFDTEAYELVEAKKPADVISKVAKRIHGGGGTKIQKALEKTLERMRSKDMVLVLTDGHIFDIDEPAVRGLLSKVTTRASACAFATVDKEIAAKGWKIIKLEARENGR
jgi:predicted metal-dependent peptidase